MLKYSNFSNELMGPNVAELTLFKTYIMQQVLIHSGVTFTKQTKHSETKSHQDFILTIFSTVF